MIHIKNAKKSEVLVTLENEANFLVGLNDNLTMLMEVGGKAREEMDKILVQNAVLKGITQTVRKEVNGHFDLLTGIKYAVENLNLWIIKLREQFNRLNTKTFDDETLTFRERGMLDGLSAINFFNRYTTMVLDILTIGAYDGSDSKHILNKIDLTMFTESASYYGALLVRFNQPAKTLNEMIENLSDELADEMSEQILRGAEGDAAVSIRKGLAPHQLNPVHWFYLWRMRRDVETLRVGQEQIDVLAMKIARLNNRNSGVEDPALDAQIEVYTDKITKIKARQREIIERYS